MSRTRLPREPIVIPVSAAERSNGSLEQRNLEIATRALIRDGLVVLEDTVDHAVLDRLNEKMVQDAYVLQARKNSPYNFNKGNIQQDPPLTPSYFEDSIYINPIVTQVTSSILGAYPSLRFISGNTALPPTADSPPASQPMHSDADFDHPLIPFALVINIPLVTMTPENGSTELWLGTHSGANVRQQVIEQSGRPGGRIHHHHTMIRKDGGPCQPTVKKGSVVVRDLRLWHAGKPNFGDAPRVMLAMIHFAPWYRNQMEVEFAEGLRDRLGREKTGLHIAATFASDEDVLEGYLRRPHGNAYDFDQVDKIEGVF